MANDKQPQPIAGLHHVTAIASDPQRNLDFYTQVLGLRLVKRTINFDDPGTYHLYFGDTIGSPGTILTFFPWPNSRPGSPGVGETSATAFSVPTESLPFWKSRLFDANIKIDLDEDRFGDRVLGFKDPDGMRLELVGHSDSNEPNSAADGIPSAYAIRGFFGVTLSQSNVGAVATVLERMGFHRAFEEGDRFRFSAAGEAHGRHIDILHQPGLPHAHLGAGSVHHIAFRVSDDEAQLAWQEDLQTLDLDVTPVLDRMYFHSIYFREPGGVLFEIATDPPGFTVDEPLESLGEKLQLPEWLEPNRTSIEQRLPTLSLSPMRSTDEPR